MKLRKTFALVVSVGLLAGTCLVVSQASDQKPSRVTINYENVDVKVVAEAATHFLGKTIHVDPSIRTAITWKTGTLTIEEAYKDFVRVLTVHNFTVIEGSDGVVRVTPRAAVTIR
jgi:type II secretory pathway component GspD/PulD (secretin)